MRRGEPLYRKVNTRARGVHHGTGGDYRNERNTKREQASDARRGPMRGRSDRGLDYTPLYQFLISRVGARWDDVHREAVARLDREDPIYHLVARTPAAREPYVRVGESTYYSGLYVDDDNRLQLVDPEVTATTLEPRCACCTHTLNGVTFVKRFRPL